MNRLVCVTGLPGSGKSVVADYFVSKGFSFVRFGQITLDLVKQQGKEPTEALERKIREDIRKEHGMAAYAKLNMPKFKKLLVENNVVADGLRSYEEYKFLKGKFGDNVIVIAVFAPPKLRHQRVSSRKPGKQDRSLRLHTFTKTEAPKVDLAQLLNLNMGPTIALADYTIINTKDKKYLLQQSQEVFDQINISATQ